MTDFDLKTNSPEKCPVNYSSVHIWESAGI